MPPTPERLMRLLEVFAAARYNMLLLEWEDCFPWTVDRRFRGAGAYTPEQVVRFHDRAQALGIEIIPLVQCLGHLETVLRWPEYQPLREISDRVDTLNPLAPGAHELIERLIDDVLMFGPPPRYFHLGGDEGSFGEHPDTRAFIEKHGKAALYLQHIEPILDKLNKRGIRPILWHDMMCDWDGTGLRRLAASADLCVWSYQGHPDNETHLIHNTRVIERFREHGLNLWGATAFSCGVGAPWYSNADLPDLDNRLVNAAAWAELSVRCQLHGVIATGWTRMSTHGPQMLPLEGALDSVLMVGAILYDGKLTDDAPATVHALLESLGEAQRFETCRTALQQVAAARLNLWSLVIRLRECLACIEQEPLRAYGRNEHGLWHWFGVHLDDAEKASHALRTAFDGLVATIWVERYLYERFEPLREEFRLLKERGRVLHAVADQHSKATSHAN